MAQKLRWGLQIAVSSSSVKPIFSFRMMRHCPDWYNDIEVARYFLSKYCLIHLNNDLDKVRLLAFMTRKLFRLSQNRGMVDNPDSPENHEALLPGMVKLKTCL